MPIRPSCTASPGKPPMRCAGSPAGNRCSGGTGTGTSSPFRTIRNCGGAKASRWNWYVPSRNFPPTVSTPSLHLSRPGPASGSIRLEPSAWTALRQKNRTIFPPRRSRSLREKNSIFSPLSAMTKSVSLSTEKFTHQTVIVEFRVRLRATSASAGTLSAATVISRERLKKSSSTTVV